MTPGKILFIDQDAASRRFVADLLRQQGYAVETAASGRRAYRLLLETGRT